MDIKLERYRIFVSVAETGSFSAAAESLFITQSAVSQNVKQLEEALGSVLFFRRHDGVVLTQAGKVLYKYASHALAMLSAAEHKLGEYAALTAGELPIAASDTLCMHWLMPYLEKYHAAYPGIRLSIYNRVTSDTITQLKSGRAEIAFINLPYRQAENDETLRVTRSMTLHETFVCGSGYPMPASPLSPKEIASLPLIMLESNSNTRSLVDEYFSKLGVHLEPEIELGSHDLLIAFAEANIGVSCVTREFAAAHLQDGRLREIPLTAPLPPRAVGVCTMANVPLSAAATAFLRFVLDNRDD